MAYTGNSIVDYLTSVGQNSSYANRATLAARYGIQGYTGSAAQNTQLLNILKSGASATPASLPAAPATPPASPVTTFGDQVVSASQKLADQELADYAKLFTSNDPFAYDQALADQSLKSATEKYDPEFKRQLDQWLGDVGVKMGSFDSRNKLIDELSTTSSGLGGVSKETYRQAQQSALEGFSNRGLLSSGVAQTGIGQQQNNRNFQLGSAADNLMRQNQQFQDVTQNTIAQGQFGDYRDVLARTKIIPALSTYTLRYPGANGASQAADLIKQFQPWVNNTGPSPSGSASAVPNLSRQIGL